MSGETLKTDFVDKYNSVGEQKFYRFLLCYGIDKLLKIKSNDYKGTSPELEFLDYAGRFLILYRRDDRDIYLAMSRTFRKAAHKIYRIMLKKEMTTKNAKFLNLV